MMPEYPRRRLVSIFCGMSCERAQHASVLMVIAIKTIIVILVCYKISRRSVTVRVDLGFLQFPIDKIPFDMEREMPIRFSSKELRIVTDNFTHLLSAGGCGTVYKGIFSNGVPVAVKLFDWSYNKRIEEQFMDEVSAIGRIHHSYLVRLYGFCFEENLQALVYEYMENGSLGGFIFQENRTIEFEELHEIAVGTARGIVYLHEECKPRIIHYDVKPENILLDAMFSPKVSNFGLVKLCYRDATYASLTGRMIPGYAAPEMWMPSPVTHKCDVYSFGVLLFEIIGRRKSFDSHLPESQEWFPKWAWNKFRKGELAEIMAGRGIEEKDEEMAERMVKVALWCIHDRPESRPSMSLVVKMLEGGANIPTPTNPFEHSHIPPNYLIDFTNWIRSKLRSST